MVRQAGRLGLHLLSLLGLAPALISSLTTCATPIRCFRPDLTLGRVGLLREDTGNFLAGRERVQYINMAVEAGPVQRGVPLRIDSIRVLH